jgi:ribonuclease BN (tRNA processing enzyme)
MLADWRSVRRLTVLGSCGAWPEAGRAASGFLVDYDGYRLVLDLGYATMPRLLGHVGGQGVDAVVITHEHPDHCADLSALYRERFFTTERRRPIPLYCTPGVVSRIGQLEPNGDLAEVFDVHHLPGAYQVGPFGLEAVALPHFVPNAGVRLTAPGLVLAYTGDSGPDPGLATLGADASLFVMEATHQGEPSEDGTRNLLTAREAGQWAARAGAHRLLLTHFWPGLDRSVSVAEAGEAFRGEIIAANEDLAIKLG